MKKNPIKRYLKENTGKYIIALLCMGISIFMEMRAPMVTKGIIDDVIVGGQLTLLMPLLLQFLLIGGVRMVTQYVKEYLFDVAGVDIARKMRKNLFQHLQTLSMPYFDRNNSGEILARMKDDVDRVWDSLGFVVMLIIESIVHVISSLVCMFYLSKSLTVIPIIVLPLIGFIAIILEKKLDAVYDDISEKNVVLNKIAQENLSGVRTVKAFSREDYEIDKFKANNEDYYNLNMRLADILIKYEPIISFLTKLTLIGVLLFGGYQVIALGFTIGALGAFMEYTNNILWPLENLGWLMNSVSAALASNRKINQVLAEEPDIKNESTKVYKEPLKGKVEFQDVSFSLHGTKILDHISFQVEEGRTLGIMGMTGAGKTTIVNLIERFYDVDEGTILLDDHNIKELPIETLQKEHCSGYAGSILFSDTIEENVRIGSREFMESETILEATRIARADSFIEKLKNRYETVVGERGVGLSGGQKQRISIARALAKRAPVLVFDDSTSALDTETEHEIQQELLVLSGMTKIIIAHRISAVRHADEIIVLQNGKIIERGTHFSLLKQDGLYKRTFDAQHSDDGEEN